jgi:serine/threonine protein kinase/tetratricopeptide (TPR) repeat protein
MSHDDKTASGSAREPEFDALVVQCLSRIDREGDVALEAVCAEHPELADRLRSRLRLLHEAGLLESSSSVADFPEALGDFRLLRRLGGGGMGVVYLAEQTSLGRRVALKLIRPEHLYFPGARARFTREAQAIAHLAHPGIVPVHTFGEAGGIPYLAMELVEGASLAAVLADLAHKRSEQLSGADLLDALSTRTGTTAQPSERAAMPFAGSWCDACVWIAREIAQALEHAHQRGVVHRDVKSSNVMLTSSGRVMLVDFGLASTSGSSAATRTGSALGSLPYMAPEQLQGRAGEIGPVTDVYGLGVTLFECIALRRPFHHDDATQLRAAILAANPPRLSSLAGGVPPELEAVVEVAMSPELDRRYRSAADFARDLSHVLAREPIEARPAGAAMRLRRWAQRNPARAVATALAVAIVVGGPLAFGLVQHDAAVKEREFSHALGLAKSQVDDANKELVATNSELERKRADLAGALGRERDEREHAQQNLEQALDAVDTLLTRVGDQKLAWIPQMEGVRRDLLEDALKFYVRFVDQRGDDPRVRMRQAMTQRKVSSIRGELGQPAAARESAAASVATLRELERAAPDDADVRCQLTASLVQYGDVIDSLQEFQEGEAVQREVIERLEREIAAHDPPPVHERTQLTTSEQQYAFLLRDNGRYDEAIEHTKRAVDGLRQLFAEKPDDADLQHRLGVALVSLANLGSYRSPLAVSEKRLIEAIEVLRGALERHAGYAPIRESLASALGTLGWLLSGPEIDRGYLAAGPTAEQALREAIEINDALIAQFPLRTLYQANIAGESSNLCVHLVRTGHLSEARPFGERAVVAYEALLNLEPQVADHHSHLGASLCNVAMLALNEGDAEAALVGIDRAILEHRAAVAEEPKNAEFRSHIRQWHVCRVMALLRLARWRDTLDQLREFDAAYSDEKATLWSVARKLECAGLAESDPELAEAERARVRGELRDQSVEQLRELVAKGKDREQLAHDEDLASLRDHPGFSELVDTSADDH